MPKQDSIKATATTSSSLEKTKINEKSKGSKMMQQKSGKKRTKYTALFDIANVSKKTNNQISNLITRTNPVKVHSDLLRKSVGTTVLASSTTVMSLKNSEKTARESIAIVVKNKKEPITALENKLKSKQCKKLVLTSENYEREMFKICTAIVDDFLKKARAKKNAAEDIANKKVIRRKSIASVDISKKESIDDVCEGL